MQGDDTTRGGAGLKLEELAAQAGVSARTVRYYVQRGLLPAPVFRGKDTAYGPEHLARLRAVKRLQERFWPLDRIEAAFAGRTLEEIERLAQGDAEVPPAPVVPLAEAAAPLPKVEASAAIGPEKARMWLHVTLAPGLELQLAADADETARTWAREIETLVERWARDGGPHGSTR